MAFITVAQQVLILFILMGVGVICGKTRLINERSVKTLTDIVLYFVTPCVLIKSFADIPFSEQKLKQLLLVFLIALLIHIGMILLSLPLVRDADNSRQRMLQFALIFSNAGYMGLPLQEALLGSEGTFFGGAYIAIFNIVLWTYGLYLMSGDKKTVSPQKALLSPGVLGVLIGFALFLLPLWWKSFTLPSVIATPIAHLAALNTPLPMLIIGYYLADIDFKALLRDGKSFYVILLRTVGIPLFALGALYVCGIRGNMLVSLITSVSTPTAAATTMFATKYDRYPAVSCNIVSLSTLLTLITMPLVVGLASILA